MGKYSTTAFFTHSFTVHPSEVGSATRSWPASRRLITSRMESVTLVSCKRSRLFQASFIRLSSWVIITILDKDKGFKTIFWSSNDLNLTFAPKADGTHPCNRFWY